MNAGVKNAGVKNAGVKKRLLVVWLILSLITLVYLAMDYSVDSFGMLRPSTVVTVSAIVMAIIKVRVIFREFMEVGQAPILLCRLTDISVAIIGVSVLGSYFLGMAFR